MFGFYRAEFLKLKSTKIYLAALLPVLLCNLVSLLMLLPKASMTGGAADVSLQEVFYRQGNVITVLGPFVFALITGYVISREYSDRAINQLFTYPVSRARIFGAKLGVVFTIVAAVSFLSCAAAVLVGIVMASNGAATTDMVMKGLGMNAVACVFTFGTIPVAAAVSMASRSIIPPMVLGTLASMVTLVLQLGHGMKSVLFPWATPYFMVREFGSGFAETGQNPYIGAALVILSLVFAVSLIVCLSHYSKAEIHSGS